MLLNKDNIYDFSEFLLKATNIDRLDRGEIQFNDVSVAIHQSKISGEIFFMEIMLVLYDQITFKNNSSANQYLTVRVIDGYIPFSSYKPYLQAWIESLES